MKMEFSTFNHKDIFNSKTYAILFIFCAYAFIFPFIIWTLDPSIPFSFNTLTDYIQRSFQHYPVSEIQADFTNILFIALALLCLIGLLLTKVKLVITPEKIYYSLFNIPLMTWVERKNIEYCQYATLKFQLNPIESFLTQYLTKIDIKNPKPKLYFFPLKNIQNTISLEHIEPEQRNQIKNLLKQHYHFQDDCPEIILDRTALNNIRQQELGTKVSPRIAFVLCSSIPISIVGMILTYYMPFFTITNYPSVPFIAVIWTAILIPSYIWIKKDIETFAFFGALIASFFITIGAYLFLIPTLHGYYTSKFGQTIDYPATLKEIQTKRQIWESDLDQSQFFFNKQHPSFVDYKKVGQKHVFTAKYHWHNYIFSHDAFINDKNTVQKKDR